MTQFIAQLVAMIILSGAATFLVLLGVFRLYEWLAEQ